MAAKSVHAGHALNASGVLAEARRILITSRATLELCVFGVQLERSLKQRCLGFDFASVRYATLYRTYGLTRFGLVEPHALRAKFWIDDVDIITFGNCLIGAFRFAGAAVDTVLGDSCRHGCFLDHRKPGARLES